MIKFNGKSLSSENSHILNDYKAVSGRVSQLLCAEATASSINFEQARNFQNLSKLKKRVSKYFGLQLAKTLR